jgi:hypothetical protein
MKHVYFFVTAILFSGVSFLSLNTLKAQNCWATGYDPTKWSFAWNCSGLAGTCGQNPTNPVTGAGNYYYDLSPKDVSGGVSHGQSNAMWYKTTKDFAATFTISWEFRFRKDANNASPYPPTAQDNFNDGYQLVFVGVPSGNTAPTAQEACWAGQSGGAIGGFWYNGSNVVTGTQGCGSGQVTVGHTLVIQFDMVDNKLSGNTDNTEPGIQEHLGIGHSNGGQPIHTFNFCAPVTLKPGAFSYPASSVRDGNWHSASVTWTPGGGNTGSFTVVVDGNTRMSGCAVPASLSNDIRQAFNFWSPGTKTAMWGFTGAAGPDATISNADDVHIRFPCIVAPVDLLNFDASLQENKTVLLNWRTAHEQNNAYFLIERSEDGINYETIGKIKGKNISNEINEYSFTDFGASEGTHYYRLKQVDLNGKYEYSKWARVVGSEENYTQQTIRIYPNPGNGVFIIDASGFDKKMIEVELYNVLGELLYKRTQKLENVIDMNISNQPKGIYFIKLSDGMKVYSERFIKE